MWGRGAIETSAAGFVIAATHWNGLPRVRFRPPRARIWDVRTGFCITVLDANGEAVHSAGFSLDDVMSFKRFDTIFPAFPMRRVKAHKLAA